LWSQRKKGQDVSIQAIDLFGKKSRTVAAYKNGLGWRPVSQDTGDYIVPAAMMLINGLLGSRQNIAVN
jgi:hypothetical protein